MNSTKTPIAIASIIIALAPVIAEAQTSTQWKQVDRSLSQLLSDGWQIVNFSAIQLFKRESAKEIFSTNTANVPIAGGIALASVPIGAEYNFLIQKAGKYVICIVSNPEVDNAASRCRQLN